MTDRVHGLSSHEDFGRVVADHGREDGFVTAGDTLDAALQRSREALARIPDAIPPRPTLLAELADSLRRELAVLGDDPMPIVAGMRMAYRMIIPYVDEYVRREAAVAQAKAEFHARNAERAR